MSTSTTWSTAAHQELDRRLVVPLDDLATGDWRLKVYGISARADAPGDDLVTAARELAPDVLPHPATGDGRHGVGFLVVHDGAVGRWALFYWWSHNILLCERLFRSAHAGRPQLEPVTDGLIACVYELQVVEWERQRWLRCLGTGVENYLADRIPAKPALGWEPGDQPNA